MDAPQVYARTALLSAASALLLFILLHFLKQDVDPAWHLVSEYALGRHGWAMTLCFLFLSLGCVASALAVFPFVHTTGGKVGLVLLFCASAALALAAIFPTDPIAVRQSEASRAANLHGLSVLVGVPALTAAALLVTFSLVRQPRWRRVTLPLIGFAHLAWISLALTIAVVAIWMPESHGFGPTVPVGWPNRFMFVAYFGWLASLSWPISR